MQGMSIRHGVLMTMLSGSLLLSGCSSTTQVGATGVDRKQLLLVSSEQVNQLSAQSYREELSQAQAKGVLDRDPAMLARLKRIANRMIPQVTALRADARSWNWEVHTLNSNELNAYCAPCCQQDSRSEQERSAIGMEH
mgnify:CR=1 FL=1